MPTLTWRREAGGQQVFRADGPQISIGRDVGNDVQLDSTFVSRRHAVIQRSATTYAITDLGSSNGTFVNGARVQMSALAPGDTIKLGSEELLFAVDAASPRRLRRLALAGLFGILVVLVAAIFLSPGSEDRVGPSGSPASAAAAADAGQVPEALVPTPGAPAPSVAPGPTPGLGTAQIPGPPVTVVPATPGDATATPIGQAGGAEALYDAALARIRGDRLVEARRLLNEAIAAGAENPSVRQRLWEVEATIRARIEQHLAAGQRQVSYLRFREAILEWEQVVALTDPSDPRHQQALEGIERARVRLGRR